MLDEVGQRLYDHVRLEEREIFGWIERVLSEAELAELLALSRRPRFGCTRAS